MVDYTVVSDGAGMEAASDAMAAARGPVAVDVERASGYRYWQKAYLVQMHRDGAGTFLFDPTALDDFTVLQEAIGAEEWVLHAADQDLPSLRELHLAPPRLFDTELAARLLGHEHVGLGAVVERTLGVTLAKEHSAADWSTRPLPAPWLEYAALDVEYLVEVRDVLAGELRDQGKVRFADEEFAAELARPPKPPRADPWRRLHGLSSLRGGRALAVARELWTARDELARQRDVSPGRLVPDRSLVAAVRAKPASKSELAGVREFTGRASRTELDRWWEAIRRGLDTADLPDAHVPGTEPPPVRGWHHRHPDAEARYRAAHDALEGRAEQLRMPVENLMTPRVLRAVAWEPPERTDDGALADALRAAGARPWQVEQTASLIAGAFVRCLQDARAGVDSGS